jgi:hypothetical protein
MAKKLWAVFACFTVVLSTSALAEGAKLRHLNDCCKSGKLSMVLTGDGTSTSHCELGVTDKDSGQSCSTALETVCISEKHRKPPPTKEVAAKNGITYKIAGPAPKQVTAIIRAARKLAAEGKYASVPWPAEKRQSTIAQLAVWRELGKNSSNAADKISPASIKEDLLSKAKVKESALTPAENSEIQRRVDLIFEAVDLTNKEGKAIAESPQEDTFTGEVVDSTEPDETRKTDKPAIATVGTEQSDPTGDGTETCSIPAFTVFECSDHQYQDMMTIRATTIHCPSFAVLSAGVGAQPAPNDPQCCISYVEVTNPTKDPIVYQLTHEETATTKRKILFESNFVQPGGTTRMGEIREKCVDIVAFVPGVVGATVFNYCCQGVQRATVVSKLPGFSTISIESIKCVTPVVVSPPSETSTTAPTTPTQQPPGQPGTSPTTSGNSSTPTIPTQTLPGQPGTTSAGANQPTSPVKTGAATGSRGQVPPAVVAAPIPSSGGKKAEPSQPQNRNCQIVQLTFTNDYKEPVLYELYSSGGSSRESLRWSQAVSPGESVTLSGKFGSPVRAAAVLAANGTDGRPLSIQEFSCTEAGEQLVVTDYEGFKRVTIKSAQP